MIESLSGYGRCLQYLVYNLNSATKFESKSYLHLRRIEPVCWRGAACFIILPFNVCEELLL